ncbi:hypothetical protein C4N9_04750 [Pararhodobacter marinus]|uniref:SH3b domain-containing protein n=1 Tax=Pararhodobacter marinus TaxID=2184063 RepID=A0A2U2CGP8_9RHOB|nr:hypothetical protein [Pararhodobacter marinus]PWE31063.1 hypothetical protein C4N9_04750 [Pararhodobacter marinus]
MVRKCLLAAPLALAASVASADTALVTSTSPLFARPDPESAMTGAVRECGRVEVLSLRWGYALVEFETVRGWYPADRLRPVEAGCHSDAPYRMERDDHAREVIGALALGAVMIGALSRF